MKLAENKFKLVPAGEHVALTISEAALKPKANPTMIEITFSHEDGGSIKNKDKLVKDRKTGERELEEKSAFPFSCLARCVFGDNMNDFSLSNDLPAMVGAVIDCEVTHSDPEDNDKGYVYANVHRTNKLLSTPNVPTAEPVEEDDDL